jgi:hypothetical protein
MNPCLKSNWVAFLLWSAAFQTAWPRVEAAVTIKDDIKLSVSASKDENGLTRIDCVLTNASSSVLAYNYWHEFQRFQVSLYDENGNQIPQEPKWEKNHGQGSSIYLESPRGAVITVYKKPGEKIEESFLLKDAYGERASMGRKLMLSWWNNWRSDTLDIPTTADPETGRMRYETVPTRWKGDWDISVSMALNASGEAVDSPPESEAPHKQDDKPKESVRPESPENTDAKPSGEPTVQRSPTINPLWWLLGIVLLAFLIWHVIRRFKAG